MPIHTYTNWNKRSSDGEKQIEPYRKYFFICEGANVSDKLNSPLRDRIK